MTHLAEMLYVKCPYHRAREYLSGAINAAIGGEQPRIMRLRVPLADLNLEKDVLVTFAADADPKHFDEPWRVHWSPSPGGPYPVFDGTLTVRSSEDYDAAVLELTGEYEPPLGAVGKVFDAALGQRIARATARDLLEAIGGRMEAQYTREESSKRKSL